MNRHLSNDELMDLWYGLTPVGSDVLAHQESCPECRARAGELETLRRASAEPAGISAEALAAQRRAILARLDQRPRRQLRWAPAVAAAALAVAVAIAYRPAAVTVPPAEDAAPQLSDDALLAEIYAMDLGREPRAAAPIRALFEEVSAKEGK